MLKAATALKVFYPNFIHFTCLVHGLQYVAEEGKAMLLQVNKLISMTKKVFLKAPHRVQPYKHHLQDTPLTPGTMPTRWGTWTETVNFYSEQFETVESIIAKFPSESAVSVCESQSAFSDPEAACSIAYICSSFGWLLGSIKCLEYQGLPLQECVDIMKNASEKLNVAKGEAGESVGSELQVVLKRNPVCQVPNGDDVDPPEGISPEKIPLLKYTLVTTCDVEQSFLAYRHLLSDKRQSLTPENLEKILIVYYA
jgi:hypothetical protein